jgi:eukaryotic-like serine/threonine-protein kinase
VPQSKGIQRYAPEELLASVGLVDTYRARVADGDGLVALKVLFLDRAEPAVAALAAQRFAEAGRRAAEVSAPGIARVLEVGEDAASAFVATEWLTGSNLANVAERASQAPPARLDPAVAGLICAEMAVTLGRAHGLDRPLHHLGLCPENVVVTADGGVALTDFGLGASVRGAGAVPMAKWRYAAPELIGADVTALSVDAARAADYYALGLVLRFLLEGHEPAVPSSLAELAERSWEPLTELAGVPTNLVSAVRLLTAADPAERPESAHIVVEWLSGRLSGQRERWSRIESALRGLAPGKAEPPRAVGARVALSLPRPGQRTSSKREATGGPAAAKHVTARTETGRSRPRLEHLAIGATLVGLAIAAVVMVSGTRRSPSSRSPTVDAGPAPAAPAALRPAEIPVAPHDGGAHGFPLALAPPAEVYRIEAEQAPSRSPGHLFLDTSPSQADVWVDGNLRGKTPVDLLVGKGSHRVVAVKEGYRILRAVFDTTLGEFARRGLQRAGFARFGDGLVDIDCVTTNRYPIFIDDEETGLLCPTRRLPVPSGKHSVGIFVPNRRANVTVEVVVPPGRQPKRVAFKE